MTALNEEDYLKYCELMYLYEHELNELMYGVYAYYLPHDKILLYIDEVQINLAKIYKLVNRSEFINKKQTFKSKMNGEADQA